MNAPNQICKDSILESFYVDDYVGGAASESAALKLQQDVTSTLASVGMQIRKWASSSKAVMAAIPPELRENKEISFYEVDQNLKTLGLLRAPEKDCFRYEVSSKMDLPTSLPVPQLISSSFEDVERDSPKTSFLNPSSRTTPVVNFGVKNLQEERPQNCKNFDKSSPYTCPNTRSRILDLPEQMRSQKKYSKIPLEGDFGQLWSSEKPLSSASNQAKLVSAYSKSLPQSISDTLGQIQDISKDDLCQISAYCGQLCNDEKQSSNARTSLKKVSMDYLQVPHDFPSTVTTRRIISSNLGRVFDPLGLVTPVTILPKILFQMTWEPHLGWDDDVGAHIGKSISPLVGFIKASG